MIKEKLICGVHTHKDVKASIIEKAPVQINYVWHTKARTYMLVGLNMSLGGYGRDISLSSVAPLDIFFCRNSTMDRMMVLRGL